MAWIERVRAELRRIPGEEAEVLEAGWQELASHDRPVLTLYGAYDAGKSTLLKRLLVDDGREVPPWLTVSARHETFEVREAAAFGCMLRDTPGISAGSSEREVAARRALTASDGILVLLPPQLATSELSSVVELLTGRLFHPRGCAFPAGSVFLVVSRMDEAGGDPQLDPEGYEALCRRKRAELLALLERHGVPSDGIEIHIVAPDAFQLVGNQPVVERASYDAFRSWDGMEQLEQALQLVSRRRSALRAAARFRYFLAAGEQARQWLVERLAEERSALREARSAADRHALAEQRLSAIADAAKTSAIAIVEEEILHVSRGGYATDSDVAQRLGPRLEDALMRWEARYDQHLDELLREFDSERAPQERSDPQERSEPRQRPDDASPQSQELAMARAHGEELATPARNRSDAIRDTMMAARVVRDVRSLAQLSFGKRPPIEARASARALAVQAALTLTAPALLELAPLLLSGRQDAREAVEKGERRCRLRELVREIATQVARGFLGGEGREGGGWNSRVGTVRRHLAERFHPERARALSIALSIRNLEERAAAISALLREAPLAAEAGSPRVDARYTLPSRSA